MKIKDHYDIKSTNYSSNFMFKTWLLLMKDKTKFVSESNNAIFQVLGITTGLIGGLIPNDLFDIFYHKLVIFPFIITMFPHVICYNTGWVLSLLVICKLDCIHTCIQDGYLTSIMMEFFNLIEIPPIYIFHCYEMIFIVFSLPVCFNHFIPKSHIKRRRINGRNRKIYE